MSEKKKLSRLSFDEMNGAGVRMEIVNKREMSINLGGKARDTCVASLLYGTLMWPLTFISSLLLFLI